MSLSYEIIEEMMTSGPIIFAVELKRAQLVSVFRNFRTIQIHTSNEKLHDITGYVVNRVLPHMMFEISKDALIYGSAFLEKRFEHRSMSEMGIGNRKTTKQYMVPKTPVLVPHKTIKNINRTEAYKFDGFTQGSLYSMKEIKVPRESALVIPYNGFSRNLWGKPLLESVFPLWFWYDQVMKSLVKFSEVMGDPPRKGRAPSTRSIRLDNGRIVSGLDYILSQSANLPNLNSIVLPSDINEYGNFEWEVEYMNYPDVSQPFVDILNFFTKAILNATLSGDMSITSSYGADLEQIFNRTNAHDEMTITSWLPYINDYFIKDIAIYNFPHTMVWLEVQGLDPVEREFLINVMNIAGNSAEYQDVFYQIDWEALGRISGLPIKRGENAATNNIPNQVQPRQTRSSEGSTEE